MAIVALLATIVVAAVVGGAALLASGGEETTVRSAERGRVTEEPAERPGEPPVSEPPPPPSASDERLAPAPEIPLETGPFTFLDVEVDGDPVSWDPCDPIRYVVNDRVAPDGAEGILDEAIDRVEEETGLVFEHVGSTDEPVVFGELRPLRDPERYGPGWSPVLISWIDVEEDPELTDAAGLALPLSVVAASGEEVYVSGVVEMNGPYAQDLVDIGQRSVVLSVMMHELGHLVGLGHVPEASEVMSDDPNATPSVWGVGDRAGLARVGQGECEPDV